MHSAQSQLRSGIAMSYDCYHQLVLLLNLKPTENWSQLFVHTESLVLSFECSLGSVIACLLFFILSSFWLDSHSTGFASILTRVCTMWQCRLHRMTNYAKKQTKNTRTHAQSILQYINFVHSLSIFIIYHSLSSSFVSYLAYVIKFDLSKKKKSVERMPLACVFALTLNYKCYNEANGRSEKRILRVYQTDVEHKLIVNRYRHR